jgi:hypothetical protein
MKSLPIANCRLPIERAIETDQLPSLGQSPIEDVQIEQPAQENRQSAIGNWK